MSKHKDSESAAPDEGVINWEPPAKRDLVERAVSDGMTDPAEIVAWATNYNVTMTIEEVVRLEAELKKAELKK